MVTDNSFHLSGLLFFTMLFYLYIRKSGVNYAYYWMRNLPLIKSRGVKSSDILKDINITSSSLVNNPQSQQLEFDQAASDSPVTSHKASMAMRLGN